MSSDFPVESSLCLRSGMAVVVGKGSIKISAMEVRWQQGADEEENDKNKYRSAQMLHVKIIELANPGSTEKAS